MADEPANKDDLKGRVKEAAGDLTDDEDLQREGRLDRVVGGVKEAVDNAADKVKGIIRKEHGE